MYEDEEILKIAAAAGADDETLEKIAEYQDMVNYLLDDTETLNKYASAVFAGKLQAYFDVANAMADDDDEDYYE